MLLKSLYLGPGINPHPADSSLDIRQRPRRTEVANGHSPIFGRPLNETSGRRLTAPAPKLSLAARRAFYRWPVAYGKSKVNHAGQLFAEHVRAAAEGRRSVGDLRAELLEAIEIIDWWRGEHAKCQLDAEDASAAEARVREIIGDNCQVGPGQAGRRLERKGIPPRLAAHRAAGGKKAP